MGNVQFTVTPSSQEAVQGEIVQFSMKLNNGTYSTETIKVSGSIPNGLGEITNFDPSIIVNGNNFTYTSTLNAGSTSIKLLKIAIGENAGTGSHTINFDTDKTSPTTASLQISAFAHLDGEVELLTGTSYSNGDDINYKITVSNTSNTTAQNVLVVSSFNTLNWHYFDKLTNDIVDPIQSTDGLNFTTNSDGSVQFSVQLSPQQSISHSFTTKLNANPESLDGGWRCTLRATGSNTNTGYDYKAFNAL